MKLILGAANAGKHDAARSLFGAHEFLDGSRESFEAAFESQAIESYHLLIRRLLDENVNAITFTERLILANPGVIVITNEIGCGIVPLEKKERIWREACGRCTCLLASKSTTVVRVVCGIPQAIKGELP